MVWFVWFSYYKTANRTAPSGMVRCGALLLAVRCGYAILRAVLVQFLRFVWFIRFSEHSYSLCSQKETDNDVGSTTVCMNWNFRTPN